MLQTKWRSKWKGPGKAEGHDGAVIFIIYGGFFIEALVRENSRPMILKIAIQTIK